MITQVLESSAVWGVLLTLAAFGLGVLINKRTGKRQRGIPPRRAVGHGVCHRGAQRVEHPL